MFTVKRITKVFAMGCMLFLCMGTAFAAPKIASPEPIFDFGEMSNTESVPHDFIIRNDGDSPLEISDVKSSCGCTVATLTKRTLLPGEETAVTATLKLSGQGPINKNITVLSNDPSSPSYILAFKGVAVAAVKYEPNTLDFGQITEEGQREAKLKLYSALDDISFNITNLSLNQNYLEASYETLEAEKSYEITVKNTEPFPDGRLSAMLTVQTDNPVAKEFRIFVTGQVVGEYLVQPEVLRLRYEATPGKTMNGFVRVSPGRVKAFNITDVVKPLESIDVQYEKQGDAYLVKLQNLPVDDTLDNKELILKTDVEGHESIVVPISIMKPQPSIQAPTANLGNSNAGG